MKTFLRFCFAAALLVGIGSTLAQQPTLMSRAIITSNAIVNGGVNVPFTEFEVDSTSTSSPRGIMTAQFNTGTDGARLHMRKARGTRASPTTVVTGDNLGRIVGTGYDGTSYLEMASIYFATEGTIATNRVPTNIQFWTATNAAPSVLTERMRITSAGDVLIGGTTDGVGKIQLLGTSGTSADGFTFATDINFFRSAAGQADFNAVGADAVIRLLTGGTERARIATNGNDGYWRVAGSYSIQTSGGPTAVTYDTSQRQIAANNIGLAGNTPSTTAVAITAASGSGITVNSGSEIRRVTYKATFTNTAFSAAAKTKDVTIATLPAKTKLVGVYADVTTTFSGGGETVASMTFGKTAGGNEYLVSFDCFTATIQRGLTDADLGTSINRASAVQGGDMPSWSATTALSCRLTTTTNNTSSLTQGSVTFYLVTEAMP